MNSPQSPLSLDETGELILRKDARTIAGMFNAVAPRYDLLNQVLSLGIDGVWRRALADELAGVEGPVLDVCTGTGDVMRTIVDRRPELTCLGLDFAVEMVRRGKDKVARRACASRMRFGVGDACRLAVADESVGAVTIAFGIRNVADTSGALGEMRRVLRPGGRALVLEFSVPRAPLLRGLYLFYFRRVLPVLGRWISGVGSAYRYLPASVMRFPEGEAFLELLRDAGFDRVRARSLSGGIATIYVGHRS